MKYIFCTLSFTALLFLAFPSLSFSQVIALEKSVWLPGEEIAVSYNGVEKPSAGLYLLNIVEPKAPDNGLDNYKYMSEYPSGLIKLRGNYWEGDYELRLLKYKSTADVNPVVVQRIKFSIRKEIAKNIPGRDTVKKNPAAPAPCNTSLPASSGVKPKGAPSVKQITDILRAVLAEGNAPRWLEGKDLCVEFGTIYYLRKSTIKLFSDWNNPAQAALPAWPVKIKVTIKIPKGSETEVKLIDNPKEAFYFYRDDKGKWNFKSGKVK